MKYLLTIGMFFILFFSCKKKEKVVDTESCFSYSPKVILIDDTISFQNCSENANRFQWDFGDGFESGIKNPQHSYTSSGEYEVQLYCFNSDGSTSLSTQTITVNKLLLESLEINPNAIENEIFFYFYIGKKGAYYDTTNFIFSQDTSIIYLPKKPIIINNYSLGFYYYEFNSVDRWPQSFIYNEIDRDKLQYKYTSDSLNYSVKFNFSLTQ